MSRPYIEFSEPFAFAYFYLQPFIFGCVAFFVSWLALVLSKCGKRSLSPKSIYWLASLPALVFVSYVIFTAKDAFLITALDTENNILAESIYRVNFDITLDKAINWATDRRLSGNVRFYASCRIADLLEASDSKALSAVMLNVASASEFQTGFGGTNAMTVGFFTPNYAEGPFSVKGIVEKRLGQRGRPPRNSNAR